MQYVCCVLVYRCVWSCDIADALKDLLPTLNRDVEVLCEGLWLIGYLIHKFVQND